MAESKYEDEDEGEEGEREDTAGDGDDHGGGLRSSTSALSWFVYGIAVQLTMKTEMKACKNESGRAICHCRSQHTADRVWRLCRDAAFRRIVTYQIKAYLKLVVWCSECRKSAVCAGTPYYHRFFKVASRR